MGKGMGPPMGMGPGPCDAMSDRQTHSWYEIMINIYKYKIKMMFKYYIIRIIMNNPDPT